MKNTAVAFVAVVAVVADSKNLSIKKSKRKMSTVNTEAKFKFL